MLHGAAIDMKGIGKERKIQSREHDLAIGEGLRLSPVRWCCAQPYTQLPRRVSRI
jgi:hypothetical protein